MSEPRIAPKRFADFEDSEFQAYVSEMYAVRKKGAKGADSVSGLTVTRTKKGALSVRRSAKARAFAYATYAEIAALAKAANAAQSDVWNLLRSKDFIITQTRMDAERIYGEQRGTNATKEG